jgi:hypothetical protein
LPRGLGALAPIPVELDSNSPNGLDRSAVLVVGTTMEQLGSKMVTGPRALPTSQVSRTFRHPAIGRPEQSAASTLQPKRSVAITPWIGLMLTSTVTPRRSATPGDLTRFDMYIYHSELLGGSWQSDAPIVGPEGSRDRCRGSLGRLLVAARALLEALKFLREDHVDIPR